MELRESRKKVNSWLKNFLSSQEIEREEVEEVFDEIPDFLLRGGKRVRPALFFEGYKIGDGERLEECGKASISIELCHSFFLMHDDIMDRDKLRRGGKTLHKAYEEKFDAWTSISLAINTGDYTNALSFRPILDTDFPTDKKLKVIEEFVEIRKDVFEGQCLDLILHETPLSDVGVKDVLDLHRLKTADYTISRPLKMGFYLSPKSEESDSEKTVEKLETYGRKIGTAFQIKDDLLGLFGEEEETGKPVTSDIEEGKRTLPLVIAHRRGTESQKEKMESIVGKKLSKNEFKTIREIVKETGAKRKSEEMAEEMVEEGKRAVEGIESDFLVDLADFIIERSY